MKIYRAKTTYTLSGMAIMCSPGELIYEAPGYVKDAVIYKPEKGGYPLQPSTVENNTAEFEFVREDTEHDADYYLKCVYTQRQWDNQFANQNT